MDSIQAVWFEYTNKFHLFKIYNLNKKENAHKECYVERYIKNEKIVKFCVIRDVLKVTISQLVS